jgi:hypothetical protein
MALSVPDNLREPWSRITDSRILRPRDELRLVGVGFVAIIGVLDSHDPSSHLRHMDPAFADLLNAVVPPLPEHHHILVQIEGQEDVTATGMRVGEGTAAELILGHVTRGQRSDPDYNQRVRLLRTMLQAGDDHGLYYASDQEQLSSTPRGQLYVAPNGGLDVDAPAPPPLMPPVY